MSYEKFSCCKCNKIPPEKILKCTNKHIYCPGCVKKNSQKCIKCDSQLIGDLNQAFKDLLKVGAKNPCKYKERGCTWVFATNNELTKHSIECKFQPYHCIGEKLGLWRCCWENCKHEIRNHLIKMHNIKEYSHNDNASLYFNENNSNPFNMEQMRLVNAFNKSFIFLYKVDYEQRLIFIIIYLLGLKQDASKYMYELSILSCTNNAMKISFTLPCFADTDDIKKYMQEGKCVCLPFNVARTYSDSTTMALSFSFRMFKVDVESE